MPRAALAAGGRAALAPSRARPRRRRDGLRRWAFRAVRVAGAESQAPRGAASSNARERPRAPSRVPPGDIYRHARVAQPRRAGAAERRTCSPASRRRHDTVDAALTDDGGAQHPGRRAQRSGRQLPPQLRQRGAVGGRFPLLRPERPKCEQDSRLSIVHGGRVAHARTRRVRGGLRRRLRDPRGARGSDWCHLRDQRRGRPAKSSAGGAGGRRGRRAHVT